MAAPEEAALERQLRPELPPRRVKAAAVSSDGRRPAVGDHHNDTTRLILRNKRCLRKSSKARPSRAQAAREQEDAIKEALQLSNNFFFALTENPQIPSDTT
ncbi:hypothetical protein NDU88_005094 [Pleurodeles waltl]|uniref:Uncharacterized protein n=1 Tax=Pleurodeles waltl TaxID=8319 RepID=A0AAV7N4V9_PLEWA|nr:hypothetical protein NDU88_005094 [Pleurodeles waltl]